MSSVSDLIVDPEMVGKVAEHVPGAIDAAGNAAEKAGRGIKTVFSGVSDPLNRAHETSTSAEVQKHAAEMQAIAQMDEGKLKTYFREKANYEERVQNNNFGTQFGFMGQLRSLIPFKRSPS